MNSARSQSHHYHCHFHCGYNLAPPVLVHSAPLALRGHASKSHWRPHTDINKSISSKLDDSASEKPTLGSMLHKQVHNLLFLTGLSSAQRGESNLHCIGATLTLVYKTSVWNKVMLGERLHNEPCTGMLTFWNTQNSTWNCYTEHWMCRCIS